MRAVRGDGQAEAGVVWCGFVCRGSWYNKEYCYGGHRAMLKTMAVMMCDDIIPILHCNLVWYVVVKSSQAAVMQVMHTPPQNSLNSKFSALEEVAQSLHDSTEEEAQSAFSRYQAVCARSAVPGIAINTVCSDMFLLLDQVHFVVIVIFVIVIVFHYIALWSLAPWCPVPSHCTNWPGTPWMH